MIEVNARSQRSIILYRDERGGSGGERSEGGIVAGSRQENRYDVLDGWRGISILAVLACHLLPLGPKEWKLNFAAGYFGMALFFCLSGFLITSFLLKRHGVVDFLIRRCCRILPLAWLALVVGLWMAHAPPSYYLPNFLFVANLPPLHLTTVTAHFWSLGVEMQFYFGIAIACALFGTRGLWAIPICAAAVMVLKISNGVPVSIVTYYRVDEIMSGGILALIHADKIRIRKWLAAIRPEAALLALLASSLPETGWLDYLRPYCAAALVGSTLMRDESYLHGALRSRLLSYVAQTSYALYIVHPLAEHTWLGSGSKLIKYAKRPLLFVVIFAVAHVSTFYYEAPWISFGKRLSARLVKRQAIAAPATT